VNRPATRKQSGSASRAKRQSTAGWFGQPVRPGGRRVAQAPESTERAGERLVEVVVRVVDEGNVDAVETEPAEALLERAKRCIM
jgi:hypothetical protein